MMTFITLGLGPCKLHHQILLVGQERQKSQQYIHFFGILYLSRPILVNKYYMHMLSIYFIFITQDTSVFPHEKKNAHMHVYSGGFFSFLYKIHKNMQGETRWTDKKTKHVLFIKWRHETVRWAAYCRQVFCFQEADF